MSKIVECPGCKHTVEHGELGVYTHEGKQRNLYRCRGCGRVWEEITVRKVVAKNDPILKVLVR